MWEEHDDYDAQFGNCTERSDSMEEHDQHNRIVDNGWKALAKEVAYCSVFVRTEVPSNPYGIIDGEEKASEAHETTDG